MDTADGFREYAKECLRWAAEAKTEEEREAFVVLAEQWLEAALRAEGALPASATQGRWPPDARH
jgi:hypothetical protein